VRKALIPAAGRGTRFLPFTKTVPKELAPLVTTPAIEFVVAEAATHGATDVLLVTGPGKSAIAEYFADNSDLEQALADNGDVAALAAIRRAPALATVREVQQLEPHGLGDAIAHGADFAAGDPIAVLLPDDLIGEEEHLLGRMIDVYARHGGVVVGLTDVPRAEVGKYGVVAPAEGSDPSAEVIPLVDLIEKPAPEDAPSTLIIIGRYILPPEIFAALRETQPGAKGEIQITDAMRALAHAGTPVHGVVFRGRRYDTGNGLDYLKSVVQLGERHPEFGREFATWLREYVRWGTGGG
jgi:UTP--glucose-1-phosphate uridylyltransferase